MKTIPLTQAFKILEDCSAVVTEDHVVIYPALSELTGEADNEFLYLTWQDDTGLEFNANFIEENNQEIKVVGSSMFLKDEAGNEFQITVLVPQNLET